MLFQSQIRGQEILNGVLPYYRLKFSRLNFMREKFFFEQNLATLQSI